MQETKVAEGKIPNEAFNNKVTLSSFVFPDGQHDNTISSIQGFGGTSLSGSLVIPEGVVFISGFGSTGITSVSFPSTL